MPNSNKPMVQEMNCETQEVSERPMTDSEFSAYQDSLARIAAEQLAAEQKATEKAALLTRLGITAEEAALLLS